jgi:hypothetical protein
VEQSLVDPSGLLDIGAAVVLETPTKLWECAQGDEYQCGRALPDLVETVSGLRAAKVPSRLAALARSKLRPKNAADDLTSASDELVRAPDLDAPNGSTTGGAPAVEAPAGATREAPASQAPASQPGEAAPARELDRGASPEVGRVYDDVAARASDSLADTVVGGRIDLDDFEATLGGRQRPFGGGAGFPDNIGEVYTFSDETFFYTARWHEPDITAPSGSTSADEFTAQVTRQPLGPNGRPNGSREYLTTDGTWVTNPAPDAWHIAID